jgi:hypothetical protein
LGLGLKGLRALHPDEHVPRLPPLVSMLRATSSCLASLRACCRTWYRLKASACFRSSMEASRSPWALDTALSWHCWSTVITCLWATNTLTSSRACDPPMWGNVRPSCWEAPWNQTVFPLSGSTKLSPGSMWFPVAFRSPPSAST